MTKLTVVTGIAQFARLISYLFLKVKVSHPATYIGASCTVDFSISLNWMSPFISLGVSGLLCFMIMSHPTPPSPTPPTGERHIVFP